MPELHSVLGADAAHRGQPRSCHGKGQKPSHAQAAERNSATANGYCASPHHFVNAENLLVIDDAPLAAKYAENWQDHLAHSVPYERKAKE